MWQNDDVKNLLVILRNIEAALLRIDARQEKERAQQIQSLQQSSDSDGKRGGYREGNS